MLSFDRVCVFFCNITSKSSHFFFFAFFETNAAFKKLTLKKLLRKLSKLNVSSSKSKLIEHKLYPTVSNESSFAYS